MSEFVTKRSRAFDHAKALGAVMTILDVLAGEWHQGEHPELDRELDAAVVKVRHAQKLLESFYRTGEAQ